MKISYNPKSSQTAITTETAANDDIIFDLYTSKLWAKGVRIGADWADISSKPSSLKNPYAIKFRDINGNEISYDGSSAKDLTTGTYIAKLPYGFSSFAPKPTWGNTTGTSIASWNDSSGGSIDFRKDNPASGKLSIKVDGRVYVNEGTNPVLSAESNSGFWGMRTPDGGNDWIRTSNNGLLPYVNGNAGSGHSSLGTNTWYFSTAYIDKVYGSLKGNADTATTATTALKADKLTNARNIALGTDLRGSANFDGSGNITISATINSCLVSVGGTDKLHFKRIAHFETANSWNDNALLLYISQGYINGNNGICRIEFRTDNISKDSTSVTASAAVRWLVRNGYSLDSLYAGYYVTTGKAYIDIYLKTTGSYQGTAIRVLQDSRGSINSNVQLISAKYNSDTDYKEAYDSIEAASTALYNRAYTKIVSGNDVGTVNYAHNAGSANKWTTARTFTIGNAAKNVDGSGNVSWSLAEIGVRDTWRTVQVNGTSIGNNTLNLCNSTYIGLTNVNGKVTFSLVGSGTTANQAILSNGTANGWTLKTLNIDNWNTAYNFVSTITGTDTDNVINKWDEIVNFLAGITEDNKLNTLLNSKLSVYELADKTNVETIKNNGIYYSTTDASSGTLINSPFNNGFALINMTSYDGGDDLRRSRLAFNAYGEIKVSDDRDQANTAETWYNVLTSKNSGISGSTIKLNGTSITVYSSGTADGRYVKKSGDFMTGALNFANNTWNIVGDDVAMGDCNIAGCLGIKGLNGSPGLAFYNSSNTLLSKLVGTANQFQRVSGNNVFNILDTSSTYVSNGKGIINGTTITQVDNATNADKLDGYHYNNFTYKKYIDYNRNGPYNIKVFSSNISALTWGSGYLIFDIFSTGYANNRVYFGRYEVSFGHWNNTDKNPTVYSRWIFKTNSAYDCIHVVKDLSNYKVDVYVENNLWDSQMGLSIVAIGAFDMISSNSWVDLPSASSNIEIVNTTYLPFIGNSSSATKLQTARKLWGQSFDGTADVKGTLSGVAHIQFSADNSYSIGTPTSEAAHTYTRQIWARHLNASRVYTGDTNLYIGYSNTAMLRFYSGTKQSGDGSNERMTISTNGNVGIGINTPAHKLQVAGTVYASDKITSAGFIHSAVTKNANQYVLTADGGYTFLNQASNELAHEFDVNITVTSEWQDIEDFYGGNQSFLTQPGTYIVQVYYKDASADGMYEGYFSGIMSWYTGKTNSNNADEIVLHRVGHAYANTIYLRTRESLISEENPYTKLQISANSDLKQHTYKFKFKRIC